VAAVAIDGQQPRASQLVNARQALLRLPRTFLKAVLGSGRRIELVAGTDAGRHPDFHRRDKVRGVANGHKAAVAVDASDCEATVLHEFCHLLDDCHGRQTISHDPRWKATWQADIAAGRVEAFAEQDILSWEYLAESFARYWLGLTRERS